MNVGEDPFLEAAKARSRTEYLRDRVYAWQDKAGNPLTRLIANALASHMDNRVADAQNQVDISLEHVDMINKLKALDPMRPQQKIDTPPGVE